jgi:hypothetical protein
MARGGQRYEDIRICLYFKMKRREKLREKRRGEEKREGGGCRDRRCHLIRLKFEEKREGEKLMHNLFPLTICTKKISNIN